MASGIDWSQIKAQIISGRKTTGMVDKIAGILPEIMDDGKEYTVAKLTAWIGAGLNEGVPEDEQVVVNWITVKYVLTHRQGFRMVAKNTFVFDASARPVSKGKKQKS